MFGITQGIRPRRAAAPPRRLPPRSHPGHLPTVAAPPPPADGSIRQFPYLTEHGRTRPAQIMAGLGGFKAARRTQQRPSRLGYGPGLGRDMSGMGFVA